MGRRARSAVHGVLVIDKPRGPTSHDVVRLVRRALRTRAVGHAGTLDPMATGVLVVAVGEATKLVRWLTADDKAYRTTIALGAETDTLDAEGEVTERVPAEAVSVEAARAASLPFVGTYDQAPPIYSAIRVGGERAYDLARRGEKVELPLREVTVHRLEILRADESEIELEVESAKGFYVRALGRDLARALGTRGHLVALRRTRSGAFAVDGAVTVEELERAGADDAAHAALVERLLPIADACAAMPSVVLGVSAVEDARQGRRVFATALPPAATEPVALFDEEGSLVAVGRAEDDHLRVVRGFAATPRRAAPNGGSHDSEEE